MLKQVLKSPTLYFSSFLQRWKSFPLEKKVDGVAKLIFFLAAQAFLSYSAAALGFMIVSIPPVAPFIAIGIGTLSLVLLIPSHKAENKWQAILDKRFEINDRAKRKEELDLMVDEKCKKKLAKVKVLINLYMQANKQNHEKTLQLVFYFLSHLDMRLQNLTRIHGDTAEIKKTKELIHRFKELINGKPGS